MHTKTLSRAALAIGCCLVLVGCAPTFPKGAVAEAVTNTASTEYDVDVKCKVFGKTLWVYLPLDKLVDSALRIDPDAGKQIEHVALVIHRVVMSTDADLQFYVLVASDIKDVGAEFTLIGHVPDIRRARLLDISRGEFQRRILRDLKLNPRALGDTEGHHIQLSDIHPSKFLSEQVARRAQALFQEDPRYRGQYEWRGGSTSWEWKEDLVFVFDIDVLPLDGNLELPLPSTLLFTEVARVLRRYEYDDYTAVRIRNHATQEDTTLTKRELSKLR